LIFFVFHFITVISIPMQISDNNWFDIIQSCSWCRRLFNAVQSEKSNNCIRMYNCL